MTTNEFGNLLIAVLALIVSIAVAIVNWRQSRKALQYSREALQLSKTIYDQNINPQLEVFLDDGVWSFDKPLMLHITNLTEASAQNIKIRIGATPHKNELGTWVNFSSQPFSLLGSQSGHAKRSIDISSDMHFFLLNPLGILAHSPQSGIVLEKDGEKVIGVLRFECSWQSGVYNIYAGNSLTKYYSLRAWTAYQHLPFDDEHLQWYISNYDIENNKPTDFFD